MTAICYYRYSPRPDDEDGREVESIDTQRHYCRQYAQACELSIEAEYHDEDASGADNGTYQAGERKGQPKRPGLEQALEHVRRIRGTLVLYSLSRLTRDVDHGRMVLKQLRKAGCQLVMYKERIDTTGEFGEFIYSVLLLIDEMERKRTGSRTRDALRRKQSNGARVSDRTPYGMMEDPDSPLSPRRDAAAAGRRTRMIPCPEEQVIIKRMLELRGEGMNYRQIGRELTTRGYLCRGHGWHHSLIRDVILRHAASAPLQTTA